MPGLDDARGEWEEQAKALAEASAALWGFYTSLTAQGFSSEQALRIVIDWFVAQTKGGP